MSVCIDLIVKGIEIILIFSLLVWIFLERIISLWWPSAAHPHSMNPSLFLWQQEQYDQPFATQVRQSCKSIVISFVNGALGTSSRLGFLSFLLLLFQGGRTKSSDKRDYK